jgi:hypothetical protein
MQLDRFLPTYEFNEIHSINIDAAPEMVYQAFKNLTIAEISPLVSLMFGLRSLPARLTGQAYKAYFHPGPLLDQMYQRGFLFLAETAGCELVFGLVGRFWELSGGMSPAISSPEVFLAFDDPTYAKAASNFIVTRRKEGPGSRCTTETRVYVPDPRTRRRFAFYWRIISMGSGFIRILLLRAIKRKAEKM